MTQLTFNVREGVKPLVSGPQIIIPKLYSFITKNIQAFPRSIFLEDGSRNYNNSLNMGQKSGKDYIGGTEAIRQFPTIQLNKLLTSDVFKLESVTPPIPIQEVTHIKITLLPTINSVSKNNIIASLMTVDGDTNPEKPITASVEYTFSLLDLSLEILLKDHEYDPTTNKTSPFWFVAGSEAPNILVDYAMGDKRKKGFLQTVLTYKLGNLTQNIWSTQSYLNIDYSNSVTSTVDQIGSKVHNK